MVAVLSTEANALPDGWRLVRLGDVAEVNAHSWDPSEGNDILYLDLTSVVAPGILAPPTELAVENAPSRARRQVSAGDILVSTVRPNLRGFARVQEAPSNLIASTGFAVVTPVERADASFVYHHVMTLRFAAYLEAATTGQAYPAVRSSDVASYTLPLPPRAEQRAIAAVLDSIDEAIERTEAVIAATEQLRDSLLHELLTRGVPGWHTAWRDMPGIGTIPADWDVVRLGEVLEEGPTNGIYKPESEYGSGVWLIRIDDFVPGALVKTAGFQRIQVTEEEVARYAVRRGDILINRVNSLSHIGKSVLLPQFNEPVLFESNMMKLGVRSDVYAEFAAIVLLAQNSRSYFASRAKKAVQQVSINQQDVAQMPFPLLPLPEQHSIATTLKGVDEVIKQTREEREGLQSLKAEIGWKKRTPKSDKIERRRCQYERCPSRKIHEGIPPGSSEAGNGREAIIAGGSPPVVPGAIDVRVLGEGTKGRQTGRCRQDEQALD